MRCKTIGLIGGMSWESSSEYYRLLNETVRARFGGLHSAPCLLLSVDFAEIATLQRAGDWPALTAKMISFTPTYTSNTQLRSHHCQRLTATAMAAQT